MKGKMAAPRSPRGEGPAGAGAGPGTLPRSLSLMLATALLCAWTYLELVRETPMVEKLDNARLFFRTHNVSLPSERVEDPREGEDFVANISAIIGRLVPDPMRNTSALPRTSRREYNLIDPDTRYLLYSPSGGFTNQLLCFLSAAYLAQVTNRTLLVPPKGRHSNLFTGYAKLPLAETVPMDHALDFDYLETALNVNLQPINGTLKQFVNKYLKPRQNEEGFFATERLIKGGLRQASHAYQDKLERKIVGLKSQVVWLYGRFYTKYYAAKGRTTRFVRFSPYITEFSRVIADQMFNGTFNAFHVRLGDYGSRAKQVSSSARAFASLAKKMGFEPDVPVYLATDSFSRSYFRPILKEWNVTRVTDLTSNAVVKQWLEDFHNRLPNTDIQSSLFGLVDQLVCARAQKYVGTTISTFSKVIISMRRHIPAIMPDMVNATHPVYDPDQRKDGTTYWGPMSKLRSGGT